MGQLFTLLLTRLNKSKEIFSIQHDRKINIKVKMEKMEVITAYLDVLTLHLPGRPDKEHSKHLMTDGFRARIQNIHLLNINCVHYCCTNMFSKKV